jgi:hypothetical protein
MLLVMNIDFLNSRAVYLQRFNQLLLLSLGVAMQSPVIAASDTATVTAKIISTISLVNQNGMVFGEISSSKSPGTVILNPSGSRMSTGGAGINSTVASVPATFDVSGDPNAVYAISLPISVVLTKTSGDTMVVDDFNSLPAITGITDPGGEQLLFVGATLNVGVKQVFGSYTGNMIVTVEYN